VKRLARSLLVVSFLTVFCFAKGDTREDNQSIEDLAKSITLNKGTTKERTQRLVTWINMNLEWTATDYQKRTTEEIIRRRGGNCHELASVLERLLQASRIPYRWIAEINLQPESKERQESAEQLIAKVGNSGSVFGLRHNDHRWLEVYDDDDKTWFPADPATGLVGTDRWVEARLGLGKRPIPSNPAVADIMKDMIAPFTLVALETRTARRGEDRSEHYLIDEFNRSYNGKLETLPAWPEWRSLVHELSKSGALALAGEANLHQKEKSIVRFSIVYEDLRNQSRERRLVKAHSCAPEVNQNADAGVGKMQSSLITISGDGQWHSSKGSQHVGASVQSSRARGVQHVRILG
jgi:transglutaminase-like putative cysteine protease